MESFAQWRMGCLQKNIVGFMDFILALYENFDRE
jgi:hypothetical protein